MAYADIAALHEDADFSYRVIACYAVETLGDEVRKEPASWYSEHSWDMVAQPGFGDAYASALAATPPVSRPGRSAVVISDAQILGAVQSLLAAEA